MKITPTRLGLTFALAAGLFSASAFADVITLPGQGFSSQLTGAAPLGYSPPGSNTGSYGGVTPLTFQKFDTSQGTLVSVSIQFDSSAAADYTAYNNADNTNAGFFLGQVPIRAVDSSSNTVVFTAIQPLDLGAFDYLNNPAVASGSVNGADTNTFNFVVGVNDPITDLFKGPGSITLDFSAALGMLPSLFGTSPPESFFYGFQDLAAGDSIYPVGEGPDPANGQASSVTATYDGTVTVTYNYTPGSNPPPSVPEPASIALMGLGLGALRVFRSRKARA